MTLAVFICAFKIVLVFVVDRCKKILGYKTVSKLFLTRDTDEVRVSLIDIEFKLGSPAQGRGSTF